MNHLRPTAPIPGPAVPEGDDTALSDAVVVMVNVDFSIAENNGTQKPQVGDLICGGVCHH